MSDGLAIDALVREQRIIICCGSGGVGKTTTGAALGVLAAERGRKALVMTIDPARRLAQAMGLEALSHEPQAVAVDGSGSLAAMMLDTKRTFDRLVESYAPDEDVRDAIFANEYYQQLSSALGGSRELIAMERVLEAVQDEGYDLLVVDTPPAHHALDFLDAPKRLIDLIDSSLTGMLIRPYGLAARAQFNLFRQSSAATLKFMERLTGVELLADLSDFLLAFSSMFDGFKERSHRVMDLMREPTTSFLLICAPEPASLAQVDQFRARLDGEGLRIAGILVNRVHGFVSEGGEVQLSAADLEPPAGEVVDERLNGQSLVERLAAAYTDAQTLAALDADAIRHLLQGTLPVATLPHFHHDLHSMADLEKLAATMAT